VSKKPLKHDYLGWLEYGIDCLDASWRNEMKGMRHGDCMTGDKHRATAHRFDEKATKAFDIVREALKRIRV
jgi:hypothetical protein